MQVVKLLTKALWSFWAVFEWRGPTLNCQHVIELKLVTVDSGQHKVG